MPLPTLLKKNALRPAMGEKQEDLNEYVAIDYVMNWFKDRLEFPQNIKTNSDKIICFLSETGSGKSTTFPSELYIRFQQLIKGNIVITQPRILTAMSIPNDIVNISVYKDKLILGKNIGYQTKEYVNKPLEKGILFCTLGVLTQFLKNMEPEVFCRKYKFVILDEGHIRDVSLDMVFFYLHELLKKVPLQNYPFVVIASATMDVQKYAKYFNTKTIFHVTGSSYPIKDNFLEYDSLDVIKSTIDTIKNIHINNKNDIKNESDIIVFIPGQSHSKKIAESILELNTKIEDKIIPIQLDSTIFKSANINYQSLYAKLNTLKIDGVIPSRKIIIISNLGETGLTLESLKYCIDLGLVNQLEQNPIVNSNILMVKPVTKASSRQRRGRVGRIAPGEFYAMYTKKMYDLLTDIQFPEILISDITIPILNIIMLNYKTNEDDDNIIINSKYVDVKNKPNIDLSKLNMLDDPSGIAVNLALEKLYTYGCIYSNGYPTKIGALVNKIRMLSIENIRMILSGFHYGCNISDLITIASFIQMSKQSVVANKFKSFNISFDDSINENEIDVYNYNKLKSRLYISCEFVDFLLFFYKFKSLLIKNSDLISVNKFCEENKVNYNGLMSLIEFRDDIFRDLLFNMNMNPFENNHIDLYNLILLSKNNDKMFLEYIDEITKIKKCIYEGYKLNTATYDKNTNSYISDYNGHKIESESYLIKNLPFVKNGKAFEDIKPNKILYDSLTIKKNFNNDYIFQVTNCISILSGFVNID